MVNVQPNLITIVICVLKYLYIIRTYNNTNIPQKSKCIMLSYTKEITIFFTIKIIQCHKGLWDFIRLDVGFPFSSGLNHYLCFAELNYVEPKSIIGWIKGKSKLCRRVLSICFTIIKYYAIIFSFKGKPKNSKL